MNSSAKKDDHLLIELVLDTPGSETPETAHALYTQMLKAHHSQAGKAPFLGQITAQLGLMSIKFRNTETRATGQRVKTVLQQS